MATTDDGRLAPGQCIFSVATGNVEPLMKASRDAARYIAGLEGFVAVHPRYPDGTLWFFESRDAATRARNLMEAKGIRCGRNVCRFRIAEDGVPEFDEEAAREGKRGE